MGYYCYYYCCCRGLDNKLPPSVLSYGGFVLETKIVAMGWLLLPNSSDIFNILDFNKIIIYINLSRFLKICVYFNFVINKFINKTQ